jgi:hypothetical protein
MQLRLESLNSVLVFFTALFAILGRSSVTSGVSGLAISYSLLITSTFTWCIKQASDSEMNMNSAERMVTNCLITRYITLRTFLRREEMKRAWLRKIGLLLDTSELPTYVSATGKTFL